MNIREWIYSHDSYGEAELSSAKPFAVFVNIMKGVVLAGGKGTRLYPLTKTVNKNILPVYDKPLIYYPILTLKEAGVEDILIISGPGHAGQFLDLLGTGSELGVKLSYAIQDKPLGIAHGLGVAESFAENGKIALILGDNIFENSFKDAVEEFRNTEKGARIVIKEVRDPERFGVVEFSDDGKYIINIEEKPAEPKTNWIVSGFYMYDEHVFDFIRELKPSGRGEYEITDLNNFYVKQGTMTYVKTDGEWIDAGTFDSLLRANVFVAGKKTVAIPPSSPLINQ